MIRVIQDLPDDAGGFGAVGKVEADDYKDVLDPAVAKAIAAHGTVRILYELGDECEGYTQAPCGRTRWSASLIASAGNGSRWSPATKR